MLYGTLTVVSADNISAQLLGGFTGLHSAFRKCRDCLGTKTSIQIMVSFYVHVNVSYIYCHIQFSEDQFQLRDKHTYNTLIAELDGPDVDHYARTYGLRRLCILNAILYFNILDGLVPDIMHIFLEGICRCVLKHFLLYIFITMQFISIECFNSRLSVFNFGHCDSSNIPTPLSRKNLISGSFSQSGMFFLSCFQAVKLTCYCSCSNVVSVQGFAIPYRRQSSHQQ